MLQEEAHMTSLSLSLSSPSTNRSGFRGRNRCRGGGHRGRGTCRQALHNLGIHIRKTLLIKQIAYNRNLATYANLLITLQSSVQTYRSCEKRLIAQINQSI